MDFELSADQQALQEGVRKLCEGRFPMARVRALVDAGGVDRALWGELAEAGVFSLRLPERDGGVGLGHSEAVLVFEELGRALVPGPLAGTHLAAGLVDAAVVGVVEREREVVIGHLDALDIVVTLDDALVGDAARAVATAKLMAGEAARQNGKACVQVHGGMGFTWEVDAHLYLKRAWVLDAAFGSVDDHVLAIADRL